MQRISYLHRNICSISGRATYLARTRFAVTQVSLVSRTARPNRSIRLFSYDVASEGPRDTKDFRIFILENGVSYVVSRVHRWTGKKISPWHDIPLHPDPADEMICNYVNEIPKGTTAKFEVATKEKLNPIAQDIKKGALRFFKYGQIPFNYGCLPQTFEDPKHIHPDTGLGGDNDPLDVVELGSAPLAAGQVVRVRVLGLLALIDEGETDWKILALRLDQAAANKTKELTAAEVSRVVDWFKNYKVPDGKPQNTFAFNEQLKPQQYALAVIKQCHDSWKDLLSGKIAAEKLSLARTKQ